MKTPLPFCPMGVTLLMLRPELFDKAGRRAVPTGKPFPFALPRASSLFPVFRVFPHGNPLRLPLLLPIFLINPFGPPLMCWMTSEGFWDLLKRTFTPPPPVAGHRSPTGISILRSCDFRSVSVSVFGTAGLTQTQSYRHFDQGWDRPLRRGPGGCGQGCG